MCYGIHAEVSSLLIFGSWRSNSGLVVGGISRDPQRMLLTMTVTPNPALLQVSSLILVLLRASRLYLSLPVLQALARVCSPETLSFYQPGSADLSLWISLMI